MLFLMHQMLYSRFTIAQVPSLVMAFKQRNLQLINSAVSNFSQRANIINLAVYWSVMSADEGDFDNISLQNEDLNNNPELPSGISLINSDPKILKSWSSSKTKNNNMHTVDNNIPTLLISGGYDPITPPKNGEITASKLKTSTHVVFNNEGHVPVNTCFFNLAKDFLNNPNKQLDTSCSESTNPIRFN